MGLPQRLRSLLGLDAYRRQGEIVSEATATLDASSRRLAEAYAEKSGIDRLREATHRLAETADEAIASSEHLAEDARKDPADLLPRGRSGLEELVEMMRSRRR